MGVILSPWKSLAEIGRSAGDVPQTAEPGLTAEEHRANSAVH
jgi:hypothetical protein